MAEVDAWLDDTKMRCTLREMAKAIMHILPLPECPQHLDTITQWVWDEWGGRHVGGSIAQVRSIVAGRPTCPPTLVALDGTTPVGMLGFRRITLHGREPLRLFVNQLFVVPGQREHGIGTELVRDALGRVGPEDAALYVYTHLRDWYAARGFTLVEEEAETGNVVLRAPRPSG